MSWPRRVTGVAALAVAGAVFVGAILTAVSAGTDPPAGPEIIVGPVNQAIARANRLLIENRLATSAGRPVQLPPGEIQLDRALSLGPEHSGVTLQGVGHQTVLRNAYYTATYPGNCTLVGHGTGSSYAEFLDGGPRGRWVHFDKSADNSPYRVGDVVYLFRFDGYMHPTGQLSHRRTVTALDVRRRAIQLNDAVDPRCSAAKWLDGAPIHDVAEGTDEVVLEGNSDPAAFADGSDVYVTDGTSLASEIRGEYRVVAGRDMDRKVIRLDRPLRRGYKGAALVRLRTVRGVTLRDLTIAQPVHAASNPVLFKFAVGLRVERVRFGRPGDGAIQRPWGACADLVFRDCTSTGLFAMNACHDVALRGGRWGGCVGEEGCFDVSLADALLIGRRGVHGISFILGCERITVRDCRIEGFGYNAGAGNGSPLAFGGRDCLVRDVVVAGSNPVTGNYLSGDRLRIEGLICDVSTHFASGRDIIVTNSRSKYWELRDGTTGRLEGCQPEPAKAPAGWRVGGGR